jgi:hypothetical protein
MVLSLALKVLRVLAICRVKCGVSRVGRTFSAVPGGLSFGVQSIVYKWVSSVNEIVWIPLSSASSLFLLNHDIWLVLRADVGLLSAPGEAGISS